MFREEDYLLLSGIQHFVFCRRQWALIHIEQQWDDNYWTTSGELFHKKAHREESFEKRGNVLIVRGMRVFSRELGIVGQCDVVEFQKSESGISLQNYEGKWRTVPIEYKRGKPKIGEEDELQLCAQSICLEEMLLTDIEKGYLYYGENRRRTEVIFSQEIRERVYNLCKEMHEIYAKGYTPKVKTGKRCNACSLKEICVPKLQKNVNVSDYIQSRTGEEEDS